LINYSARHLIDKFKNELFNSNFRNSEQVLLFSHSREQTNCSVVDWHARFGKLSSAQTKAICEPADSFWTFFLQAIGVSE